VIAVASGKGGVGKSSVTVNLACALAAEGHRVGVLDVDVWGFSVPRMMGVSGHKLTGYDSIAYPVQSHGVKLISMGFVVEEETPVIWRGPMLHKAVQQFLGDVYWGELDFLLADLPPGTGDVSISMAQFLPGRRCWSSPRRRKPRARWPSGPARWPARFARRWSVWSRTCPTSCARAAATGPASSQGGGAGAETLGVPLLGQIPLMPEPARAATRGRRSSSHPDCRGRGAAVRPARWPRSAGRVSANRSR
jgi:ATP-binding protein involved in chromosome partitioning